MIMWDPCPLRMSAPWVCAKRTKSLPLLHCERLCLLIFRLHDVATNGGDVEDAHEESQGCQEVLSAGLPAPVGHIKRERREALEEPTPVLELDVKGELVDRFHSALLHF